jgi:hypothetical protein
MCRPRTPSLHRLRRRQRALPHRPRLPQELRLPHRLQRRRILQRRRPSRNRASRPLPQHRSPVNRHFRTSSMPPRRYSVEHPRAPYVHPCGVA